MKEKTQDATTADDPAELIRRTRLMTAYVLQNEELKNYTQEWLTNVLAVCDIADRLQAKSDNLDLNIIKPCWN